MSEPTNEPTESTYEPPPMRLFEITYSDGGTERCAAQFHAVDPTGGALVFMDHVDDGTEVRLYYRRTIAAGQWRKVVDCGFLADNETIN